MIANITAGGRLALGFCVVWASGWIPLLFDGPFHATFSGVGLWILMILSSPLGWLGPGVTSMDHRLSHGELICYLILSGMNFFLWGYGLAGLWKPLRRLFGPFPATDTDPYSHSVDRGKSKAEQSVAPDRSLPPSLNSASSVRGSEYKKR